MTRLLVALGFAALLAVGSAALYAIESAQLDRRCADWGWTYCIPKGE